MKYTLTDSPLESTRTPCVVLSLKQATRLARSLGAGKEFSRSTADFSDKLETSQVIHLSGNVQRMLIIGGADGSLTADHYRRMASSAAAALLKLPVKQAVIALEKTTVRGKNKEWKLRSLMQALSHSAYRYNRHKSKPASEPQLNSVRLFVADRKGATTVPKLGNALDAGLKFARDLGNEPPNVCNPNYLLREARKLGKHPKVTVSNLDEKKMTAKGMGAFMAVSQGSDSPGQMIIIRYQGAKASTPPVALVGKGITFDTGGISLKPGPGMDEMKFDMCGAGAVLGATKAAIEAELKINLDHRCGSG